MRESSAEVVICGAGIAGVSVAYHLAVEHGLRDVVLLDERPPLSLTSDKSTECYRNWWPGPNQAMVSLMNRSIDLLEAWAQRSGNVFRLNRRGYLYATGDPERAADFARHAGEASAQGAGPVRIHSGSAASEYVRPHPEAFAGEPSGGDLITDPALIRSQFPFLSPDARAILNPRRCGWLSAQQLGMYLLERARERGVRVIRASLEAVGVRDDRIASIRSRDLPGGALSTPRLVLAAGPLLRPVARLLGLELPVFSELHTKVAFHDHLGVVPRDAPLMIWSDPQRLPWTEEEREILKSSPDAAWLLDPFPPGVHCRPEGPPESPVVLLLWAYRTEPVEPVFPPEFDPLHAEIALRGMSTMIPGLRAYFGRMPRFSLDGGYYIRTPENRPLIGPLPVRGAFVIGALSGFGVMASAAAGELLAAHLIGAELPEYADAFTLERYADPAYQKLLATWDDSGQL